MHANTYLFSFPPDLEPETARSLSLQLALDALIAFFNSPAPSADAEIRLTVYTRALLEFFPFIDGAPLRALLKELDSPTPLLQKAFLDALLPYVEERSSDESVLFYLLEEHEALLPLIQHLSSFACGDLLRKRIADGYSRRGFSEFYERHKTRIESSVDACLLTQEIALSP